MSSPFLTSFLIVSMLIGGSLPALSATPEISPMAQRLADANLAQADEISDRLFLAGMDDPQAVRNFLAEMRQAATVGDRQALVEMVRFPFTLYDAGTPRLTYHRPQELLQDFDRVFTPVIIEAMRNAHYEELFINGEGAMFDAGRVWFDQREDGIKIKAING